jgi:hypothetical protein
MEVPVVLLTAVTLQTINMSVYEPLIELKVTVA